MGILSESYLRATSVAIAAADWCFAATCLGEVLALRKAFLPLLHPLLAVAFVRHGRAQLLALEKASQISHESKAKHLTAGLNSLRSACDAFTALYGYEAKANPYS